MATNHIYPATGLEINFLGLPMVCNDGKTENTLHIALTNNFFFGSRQPDQDATIVFSQNTPIYIWFVVDVSQASARAVRNWALTSNDNLNNPKVALSITSPGNWNIERSNDLAGNPLNESLKGWKLTAKQDVVLRPGESLVVELSGLTTDLPDGPSSCYCQVDMPALDAHGAEANYLLKVIGPITKSSMIISGDQEGMIKPRTTLRADLDVYGTITGTTGNVTVESSVAGKLGPRLRLINTGAGKGSAAAIEFSGYDSRKESYGDVPAFRISCEDDGMYSGDLIFASKGANVTAPLTERLRLTSGGALTTSGGASIGGDMKSQGRIQDVSGVVMPVGAIIAYGGEAAPQGWLLCNGQPIPIGQDYDELRRVLGQNNAPDLRSRFIVGAGQGAYLSNYNLKQNGGEEKHTLTIEEMPRHNHQGHTFLEWVGKWDNFPEVTGHADWNHKQVGSGYSGGAAIPLEGESKAHPNLPPYYALTYIIKY